MFKIALLYLRSNTYYLLPFFRYFKLLSILESPFTMMRDITIPTSDTEVWNKRVGIWKIELIHIYLLPLPPSFYALHFPLDYLHIFSYISASYGTTFCASTPWGSKSFCIFASCVLWDTCNDCSSHLNAQQSYSQVSHRHSFCHFYLFAFIMYFVLLPLKGYYIWKYLGPLRLHYVYFLDIRGCERVGRMFGMYRTHHGCASIHLGAHIAGVGKFCWRQESFMKNLHNFIHLVFLNSCSLHSNKKTPFICNKTRYFFQRCSCAPGVRRDGHSRLLCWSYIWASDGTWGFLFFILSWALSWYSIVIITSNFPLLTFPWLFPIKSRIISGASGCFFLAFYNLHLHFSTFIPSHRSLERMEVWEEPGLFSAISLRHLPYRSVISISFRHHSKLAI